MVIILKPNVFGLKILRIVNTIVIINSYYYWYRFLKRTLFEDK